jgi:DNA-binding CsgD family transcriptional regulator
VYVVVPLVAFLAVVVLGLWTRITVHKLIKQQWQNTGPVREFVIDTMWHPFLHWFLFLGTYAAIEISILSSTVRRLVGEGVASLFVLSLMWVAVRISERLIRFYLGRVELRQPLMSLVFNVVRVTIAIIGILTIFEIWGAPIEPIIIILAAILFIVGLALRNNIDNLLAWLDIIYGEHIKVGHLIKLGSGEAGQVTQISLTKTVIKTVEGNLVIIPNVKLMTNTIVNYGASADENPTNDVIRDRAPVGLLKPLDVLTDRELEVLKLIGNGATNREIAMKLIISEHTVKSHIRSILSKLNIHNRQQAAVYAEREGLLSGTNAL